MNRRHVFDRLLAALHDAAFDEALWPARLIDEACGVCAGDNARVSFAAFYNRGERRQDWERDYFENYFHQDEAVPRLLQQADGRLARVASFYSAGELKTSATWNELLARAGTRNGLFACLGGLHGWRLTWVLADPVAGGWESSRTRMIRRLLPHIRHFVRVRQTLAEARALGSSLVHLLDNARLGVIHLDRRGRIAVANDCARDLLAEGDRLRQQDGLLRAGRDDARLQRLVAAALDGQGGSMPVKHPCMVPALTLHVHPVRQMDFPGVVVLIEGLAARLDAGLVGSALGLTPMESRVAVLLAEGKTVPAIAGLTGRAESSIRTYLKRMHRKLGVSRRADLVRRVLSAPRFGP